MSILRTALPPHRILLGLSAGSIEEATHRVLDCLRDAPGVKDFAKLAEAIRCRNAGKIGEPGREILVAHGRTECLDRLVLAAGRFERKTSAAEVPQLVFVAGIPAAFNTDYLRAIGAIARVCSTPAGYDALISAATSAEFSSLLEEAEMAL